MEKEVYPEYIVRVRKRGRTGDPDIWMYGVAIKRVEMGLFLVKCRDVYHRVFYKTVPEKTLLEWQELPATLFDKWEEGDEPDTERDLSPTLF